MKEFVGNKVFVVKLKSKERAIHLDSLFFLFALNQFHRLLDKAYFFTLSQHKNNCGVQLKRTRFFLLVICVRWTNSSFFSPLRARTTLPIWFCSFKQLLSSSVQKGVNYWGLWSSLRHQDLNTSFHSYVCVQVCQRQFGFYPGSV